MAHLDTIIVTVETPDVSARDVSTLRDLATTLAYDTDAVEFLTGLADRIARMTLTARVATGEDAG